MASPRDRLFLPSAALESSVLTRWVFLRGLGAVYFCAFASLWPQVLGLPGSRGILPARDYLAAVGAQASPERFWLVPTLAWLNSSDQDLRLLCEAGMLLSLLLIVGILPVPTLTYLWLLKTNPFPNAPPRYVRTALYDYRFTDACTRRVTGAWWQRRRLGLYFPPALLRPMPGNPK